MPKSVHVTARHVIRHILDERHTFTWHMHSFLHNDTTYLFNFSMILFPARYNPAPIYVNLSVVLWPNSQIFTGYEPKHLADKHNTEEKHFAEDQDLAEHEDLRVKPLTFHRLSTASTCGAAESIATPPLESDSDYEQIRALLALQLYMQEREANADRPQVYHSVRENLISSSSQDPKSTGRPVALFSRKKQVESRNAIQELTSQIQELQERVNCMNDSRECQDRESMCSEKLSHVPSQPAVVPSPRSMLRREKHAT